MSFALKTGTVKAACAEEPASVDIFRSVAANRFASAQGIAPGLASRLLRAARVCCLTICLAFPAARSAADDVSSAPGTTALGRGFASPPGDARPWVYWFWLDGNITRAGITADLEAMQRVGIGGAIVFDITQGLPAGPVAFGSAEWRELFHHAVSEAGRLGLKLSVHNCSGWTGSGGPWITPELAMQRVCYAQTNLAGPIHFEGPLPVIHGETLSCHDIAVLAFPSVAGEGGRVPGWPPKVSLSAPVETEGARLVDGKADTVVSLPAATARRPQYIELSFAEPFAASWLGIKGAKAGQQFSGKLEISDDGRSYRDVRDFRSAGTGLALPFEQVSARFFRALFTESAGGPLSFSEVRLDPGYHVALFQAKSGLGELKPALTSQARIQAVPPEAVISPGTIIRLNDKVDGQGKLVWDVPPGHWTILRLAYAPTGMKDHPATPGGAGLECDKLSREAIETHFAAFLGKLIADAGPAAGQAFAAAHVDSWEIGFQNWTPGLCEEFRARRGYDPLPFLPVFSGHYVSGAEQTERFLWDMRRTIADLVTDDYAGRLAELLHQHGMELSIQPYGSFGKGPFDDLGYGARADVPMLEFWSGPPDYSNFELLPIASVAHVWGKRIVAAESFTSYPEFAKWQQHPYVMKPRADAAFCEGVNRIVFHRYAHQPWLDRRPGMTMGVWGLHYERTETWWEQSRAWHEYLARCQYLLQRGAFVADVCYLTREGAFTEAPLRAQLHPAPPKGYRYDVIAPEAVMKLMSVRDGRLVLPDGMSYRLLVLPSENLMTPKLLSKIAELVRDGAAMLGAPPARSPSLEDFPRCDAEVKKMTGELWGACDGARVKENHFGKGVVIWGKSLEQVLSERGLKPDFETLGAGPRWPVRFIHRRMDGAEVYFVAQANPEPVRVECAFRVTGREPEFWRPDTGLMERAPVWREQEGRTIVPVELGPAGSVFVVFRRDSKGCDPIASIRRDGRADESARVQLDEHGRALLLANSGGEYEARTAQGRVLRAQIGGVPPPETLSPQWEVRFPEKCGAPASVWLDHLISWTEHADPGVKYFSGTAAYRASFRLAANQLGPGRRISLDLGKVAVIAELKVNGRDCGVLWKPPFEADITTAAQAGENSLEIKVTNLWPNRLIGDEELPPDCQWRLGADGTGPIAEWPQWLLDGKPSPTGRVTFTTWKHWVKGAPLLESGLLGPVVLRFRAEAALD